MAIKVELAETDAVEEVVALLNGVAHWMADKGIDQWPVDGFTIPHGLEAIERRETYIVRLDGEIVATCRLQFTPDPLWIGRPGSAAYVHKLAVHHSYRGRGLGVLLLNWAEARAHDAGCDFIRLDCLGTNARLVRYYLNAGFTQVGDVVLKDWNAALFQKNVGTILCEQ